MPCLERSSCLKSGSNGHCRHFGNYFLSGTYLWNDSAIEKLVQMYNYCTMYNVHCRLLANYIYNFLMYTFAILVYVCTSSLYIVFGNKRTGFANPNKSGELAFHLVDLMQCHRQPVPGPGHGHRQLQVRYNTQTMQFLCCFFHLDKAGLV
jgi:hypothetical protein